MKNKNILLIVAVLYCFICYILLESSKSVVKTEDYDIKIKASTYMSEASSEILNYKIENGIQIDYSLDINKTGLIGDEFTILTSTMGALDSKRTSTNPNMAAVVVDMFIETGVKAGDNVALNFSSSFPAINIATLCAVEALELDATVITSIGSSTFGGNNPDFTYIDMEHLLYEKGIISNKTLHFSLGANNDQGSYFLGALNDPEKGVDEKEIDKIIERFINYGYEFIYMDDADANIDYRYGIYQEDDPTCFVSVGGNLLTFGENSNSSFIDGGVVTNLEISKNEHGLMQLFLGDKIPAIHLLNLKGIATDYGLPIDPAPQPQIGMGGVYYTYSYNNIVSMLCLLPIIAVAISLLKKKKLI